MEILYISAVCSVTKTNEISCKTKSNPGLAAQKFNRLLAKGFVMNNCKTVALSNPPITSLTYSEKVIRLKKAIEDDLVFKYIPFINSGRIKHICVLLYTFLYVLLWGLTNRKQKAIVCDVLSASASIGALCASKIVRIKSAGIVTDLPWLVVAEGQKPKGKPKFTFLSHFTHYVFLTEYMNEEVNNKKRPYIVMEGVCENEKHSDDTLVNKYKERTVMYAGTLMEKYGIKKLVDGFLLADIPNLKLVIYGDGPFATKLKEFNRFTTNVEYRGLAPTENVVRAERQAILLVNPRPTDEIYTKYSFPSKNMEYMASGTPLLTTKLPGIPVEYNDYVFYIEDETVEGFAKAITNVLNHSEKELSTKGKRAKDYVLNKKNSIVQSARILNLLNI